MRIRHPVKGPAKYLLTIDTHCICEAAFGISSRQQNEEKCKINYHLVSIILISQSQYIISNNIIFILNHWYATKKVATLIGFGTKEK